MLNDLLIIYLTISPIVLAGILNMLFTKTTFYQRHTTPIDRWKTYKDGRRIFGDNKTYIGFVSMILVNTVTQMLCGFVCNFLDINQFNDLYISNNNTFLFNMMFGALTGFAYMIAELPNSFVKRRLDIAAGKTGQGIRGKVFFIIDQIDSLIGIVFLYWIFCEISIVKCAVYLIVGALTHILVNRVLFFMKVRKNL